MKRTKFVTVLALALLGLLSVPILVQAMGRTGGNFHAFFDPADLAQNRIFVKLDVETPVATLPTNSTGSRNDDLAGYDVSVTLGSATPVTQTFADNGRVNTDVFKARLTANGRILHVDLRGLDLPTILGLNPSDDGRHFNLTLQVKVTVTSPSDSPTPGVETVLFDAPMDFSYWQHANSQAKGKG